MKNLHRRIALEDSGLTQLVKAGDGVMKYVSLDLLRLPAGTSFTYQKLVHESALIILTGTCSINSWKDLGGRKKVFDGAATTVYLSPNEAATITAQSNVEIAIASAETNRTDLKTKLIKPNDCIKKDVGKDNWSRQVFTMIPGDFPADKLIIGETFNPPGNWSSSPPHKHDNYNPPHESKFEEVYFYRLDPQQGFGIQRVYTAEGDFDESYTVMENDLVCLPKGYHPVVAGPGYKLYYLWVLAGQGRDPAWAEDPAHSWVHGK